MNENNSKSFTLNTTDVKKLAIHALLVGGAAALTIVAENLHLVELGQWGPIAVPVITLTLNALITWMRDNTKEVK